MLLQVPLTLVLLDRLNNIARRMHMKDTTPLKHCPKLLVLFVLDAAAVVPACQSMDVPAAASLLVVYVGSFLAPAS